MGNGSALAGLLLLFGAASATPAVAETPTPDGAYARLSPGNAKIARALHAAQTTTTAAPTTGSRTGKTLTLNEIAAMKQTGQSWGQVFQAMKARGLVSDKNLGQVVSRYQYHERSGGVVATASSRNSGGPAPRSLDADDTGSASPGE